MSKRLIRITENDLHNILKESVKRVLNEVAYSKDMIFVSYLYGDWNESLFKPINYDSKYCSFNKCSNGLWASPLSSEYGWKQWCEREDFPIGNTMFTFKLRPDSKIYVIDNFDDLDRISTFKDEYGRRSINFDGLIKNGYDGIYVTENAVTSLRYIKGDLQGLSSWDVESICIFNSKAIVPISNERIEKPSQEKRRNKWDDEMYDYYYGPEEM